MFCRLIYTRFPQSCIFFYIFFFILLLPLGCQCVYRSKPKYCRYYYLFLWILSFWFHFASLLLFWGFTVFPTKLAFQVLITLVSSLSQQHLLPIAIRVSCFTWFLFAVVVVLIALIDCILFHCFVLQQYIFRRSVSFCSFSLLLFSFNFDFIVEFLASKVCIFQAENWLCKRFTKI